MAIKWPIRAPYLVLLVSLLSLGGGTSAPLSHASGLSLKPPAPSPPSPSLSTSKQLSPPPSPFPPPSGTVVTIHNETDLAQAITAATGPSTTTLLIPALLLLSKALPDVTGPLQFINANGTAVVACSVPGFLALKVLAASFRMKGISWTGCTNVLDVSNASHVTIEGCSFLNGGFGLTQVRIMHDGTSQANPLFTCTMHTQEYDHNSHIFS